MSFSILIGSILYSGRDTCYDVLRQAYRKNTQKTFSFPPIYGIGFPIFGDVLPRFGCPASCQKATIFSVTKRKYNVILSTTQLSRKIARMVIVAAC